MGLEGIPLKTKAPGNLPEAPVDRESPVLEENCTLLGTYAARRDATNTVEFA